jgi:hypothetical protein
MPLSLCTQCFRHVRVGPTSAACPFCGAATHATIGHRLPAARVRTRAAFVFAAALAATGCASDTEPTADAGPIPEDATALDAAYGAPPPPADASDDAQEAPPTDAGDDAPNPDAGP